MKGQWSMFFGVAALITGLLWAQGETNLVQLKIDSFMVVGLQARTSNSKEASPNGAIPKLWARIASEDLPVQIKNRVDDRLVAVYTDYESDHNGPYTYILGAKVSSAKQVPADMVARKVLAGKYAVFTEEGGPAPQLVVNLWRRIWSLESPDRLYRAYQTDFEVYSGGLGPDSTKTHIDIYVGLRDKP